MSLKLPIELPASIIMRLCSDIDSGLLYFMPEQDRVCIPASLQLQSLPISPRSLC